MVVVVQRVQSAAVTVAGDTVGQIGAGYLLLVGISKDDTAVEVQRQVAQVAKVRLMADADGKMGLSIKDTDGQVLAVSQFTLLAAIGPPSITPPSPMWLSLYSTSLSSSSAPN